MLTNVRKAIEFVSVFGEYALEMGEAWRIANPEIMDAYESARLVPFIPRNERGQTRIVVSNSEIHDLPW
jgi:hypothetical protein